MHSGRCWSGPWEGVDWGVLPEVVSVRVDLQDSLRQLGNTAGTAGRSRQSNRSGGHSGCSSCAVADRVGRPGGSFRRRQQHAQSGQPQACMHVAVRRPRAP